MLYCNRYKKYATDLNEDEEKECGGTWRECAECKYIDSRERFTYCNLYAKYVEDVGERDIEKYVGCNFCCSECEHAEYHECKEY